MLLPNMVMFNEANVLRLWKKCVLIFVCTLLKAVGITIYRRKRNKMEEKDQSTAVVILDNMLLMIQGNKDAKRHAMEKDQPKLYLVDENGRVNEKARSTLVENIQLLKNILAPEPEKPKAGYKFWKGGLFSSTKKVQLYIPAQVSTSSTKGFTEVFTKALKENSIQCHAVNNVSSLEGDIPLIVVCPSGSRLEPSIDLALESFSWNTQFVAVILHFGTERSLPEVESAKKLPLKDAYKNAVFIDAAYNSDAKLYNCKMNETALNRMKKFIENFSK